MADDKCREAELKLHSTMAVLESEKEEVTRLTQQVNACDEICSEPSPARNRQRTRGALWQCCANLSMR